MGITPYSTRSMGSSGFAIGDAGSMGISSWLFEIEGSGTCLRHTEELYEDLVNIYYPKCLAVFIAMSENCELKSPYMHSLFNVTYDDEVFTVVTTSNSTVHNFNSDLQARNIEFEVTGMNGTSGFCNVTIPNNLLWGEFTVYKNGYLLTKSVDYDQRQNSSHYIIDITYVHSTHTLEIRSSEGIPEFSTWMAILLISVAFLSATAIGLHLQHKTKSLAS